MPTAKPTPTTAELSELRARLAASWSGVSDAERVDLIAGLEALKAVAAAAQTRLGHRARKWPAPAPDNDNRRHPHTHQPPLHLHRPRPAEAPPPPPTPPDPPGADPPGTRLATLLHSA